MATVAFLIPVDITRHTRFLKNLAQLKTPFTDVYIILSRRTDLQPCGLDTIVLSDTISEEAIVAAEERNSMPTFKKWCGLATMLDKQYDYLICCDSEICLLRPIDQEFVDSLPSQFTFVGDHLRPRDIHQEYLPASQSFAPRHESTCGNDIYTWWSAMPVYSRSSLKDFLQYIGIQDPLKLARSLRRAVFDHLVYQHYVVAKKLHEAVFVCCTHDLGIPLGWSLENTAPQELFKKAEDAGLVHLWMSINTRQRLPDRPIYIVYHLDHVGQ